jgi:hypothetical protein
VRQVKYEYDCVKPRAGERLGEEQHVGVFRFHSADQPGPEVRRLGVRVVDPEDGDAVGDPVPDHPKHLLVEALRIVVEVQRIDVLVLLRRVLGVGDGPVGQFGEPVPMLAGPRVVGSALQRQIKGDLQPVPACGVDEGVEIGDGAQIGMHRVVATGCAADRPR